MKIALPVGATLLALGLLAGPSAALAGDAASMPGKDIFLANKCNKCHTISALKIERLPKKGKADDKKDEDKVQPPDLSTPGTIDLSADELKTFLRRETTAKDGKKHKKKFTGSDEDLGKLVDFIRSLDGTKPKDDKKAADAKEPAAETKEAAAK